MDISIVCATANRAYLLDNALYTYSKQQYPNKQWEYLLCDDGDDNTKTIVNKWLKKGLPIRYFTSEELGMPKVSGQWRDGCHLRNILSTYARGRVLIATHPEILVPPTALDDAYTSVMEDPDAWHTAIPYWLPPMAIADEPSWKKNIFNLRKVNGFYEENWKPKAPGAFDYANNFQEIRESWESEVWWAMSMERWRWFGGFQKFEKWGSVDIDFMERRHKAGIHTKFIKTKDKDGPHREGILMVMHQWHESKRIEKDHIEERAAHRVAAGVDGARQAGALYVNYNHGPRERTTGGIGSLDGILDDHIARYKFAASFAGEKAILDIPCGTGYGLEVLRENCNMSAYYGVDADQESIDFARKYYIQDANKEQFLQADAEVRIPIMNGNIDMVLCFEGIEHIEKQLKFVKEVHRVLAPGGTFIFSTPAAPHQKGTFWDKYVLTPDQLINLFHDDLWVNLEWFHQMSYGSSEPIQAGFPPSNAQIAILGGTKRWES